MASDGVNKSTNPEKAAVPPSDVKDPRLGEPSLGRQQVPMATMEDDDERLLARIGYRQVRRFMSRLAGGFSNLADIGTQT
jgi:hypothetical protein